MPRPRLTSRSAADFLVPMVAHTYFLPCEQHAGLRKNEATHACATCLAAAFTSATAAAAAAGAPDPAAAGLAAARAPAAGGLLCPHCLAGGAHPARTHRVLQIRRNVYRDVVRVSDIGDDVRVEDVQSYTTNGAKVVFLARKPRGEHGAPPPRVAAHPSTCAGCDASLAGGWTLCSLQCLLQVEMAGGGCGEAGDEGGCDDGAAAAAAGPPSLTYGPAVAAALGAVRAEEEVAHPPKACNPRLEGGAGGKGGKSGGPARGASDSSCATAGGGARSTSASPGPRSRSPTWSDWESEDDGVAHKRPRRAAAAAAAAAAAPGRPTTPPRPAESRRRLSRVGSSVVDLCISDASPATSDSSVGGWAWEPSRRKAARPLRSPLD